MSLSGSQRSRGLHKASSCSLLSVEFVLRYVLLLLLLLLASRQPSGATSGVGSSAGRNHHRRFVFGGENSAELTDVDIGASLLPSDTAQTEGSDQQAAETSSAAEGAGAGGAPNDVAGSPLTNAWNRVVVSGSLLSGRQRIVQPPLALVSSTATGPSQSNLANARAYNANVLRNDSHQQQRTANRLAANRNSLGSNRIQQQQSDNVNELTEQSFPNPNINNAGHEITKILKSFFDEVDKYDKRIRPNYSEDAAIVNVSFHIIGISSVSEVQMDFTADFYFRQKWTDPRLKFTPVVINGKNISELCVGAEFAEKIWLPDTFFANEKTAAFHTATTANTFIRVRHDGGVYRSIRLTVTCSCPMDLQYFPMDRQRCKIEIESYGYNTADIDYKWENKNESVSLDTSIELPQFKVIGFKLGNTTQNLSSGNYIRLHCEIHFVRSMGYYLIQIYIPASLIVIISWVSFWLHRNATPARVALGVTTVLTMTTLMSSTNAALPKISYIKSIDVFLGTCFVMVFASLLEYASVGYIGKRLAMKRKRQQELKQMQLHHQKVCVAAAASAAAAAHAAQQSNPAGVAHAFVKAPQLVFPSEKLDSTNNKTNSLNRQRLTQARCQQQQQQQPISLRCLNSGAKNADLPPSSNGQRSTIKIMPEPQRYLSSAGSELMGPPGVGGKQQASLLAIQAPTPPPLPSMQQPSGQPQAEFETAAGGNKQAAGEDLVRICGLTPSAIDKYSRVVFPICFVCFNLMYWIIYGHISQEIDDDGTPLIPFIRS